MGRKSKGDDRRDVWLRDYAAFLNQPEIPPPDFVSEKTLSFVRAELNPPLSRWASKFLCIHTLTGLFFMAICPQLGVGPFVGDLGLGHILMRFGAAPCAAFCGAVFLGLTSLSATLLLNRDELRVANRHRILNISFLTALSFTILILAGGESDRLGYFAWLMGAVVTGSLIMWIGARVKLRDRVRPRLTAP